MVVIFVIIVAAFTTLGYHLIMPDEWRWLEEPELRQVRSVVLSGAVVGLGTTYLRRYIDDR